MKRFSFLSDLYFKVYLFSLYFLFLVPVITREKMRQSNKLSHMLQLKNYTNLS